MVVKYSGLMITNGKGLLGGNVLSGNQAGRMASIYRRPITRYKPSQLIRRNAFQGIVAGWMTLSDAQRSGWNTAAATGDWDWTNSIGINFNPSGFQLYVKLNSILVNADTSLATAPTKPTLSPPFLSSSTPVFNTSFVLGFSPASIGASELVYIYATDNLSPGVFSPRHSKYIFVRSITSVQFGATIDIFSAWSGIFGKMVVGCSIFVSAILVDAVSGDTANIGIRRTLVT